MVWSHFTAEDVLSANLCVMVEHKLWYFDLVRVDRIKEILHSSQIVDSLLYLSTRECQEPPGLKLGREGIEGDTGVFT